MQYLATGKKTGEGQIFSLSSCTCSLIIYNLHTYFAFLCRNRLSGQVWFSLLRLVAACKVGAQQDEQGGQDGAEYVLKPSFPMIYDIYLPITPITYHTYQLDLLGP